MDIGESRALAAATCPAAGPKRVLLLGDSMMWVTSHAMELYWLGMPLQIRDADGLHLNRAGADRMSVELIKRLYER